ncbi:putative feruloyl esterase A [Mycena kentingensis (nom. inval.)]|nr:putative feruloyl esterase A [Mycena kentingensis (nom. inval.)]
MRVFALFFALACVAAAPAPVPVPAEIDSRGISSSLYDDLVRYTQYSSAAYQFVCAKPLGQTLVRSFSGGNTQGFVARDDSRKEIVVSFRGTFSVADAITDIQILLTPLVSPGLSKSVSVHSGFLDAYNDVAQVVLNGVKGQVQAHPAYSIVVTGHSLGGALASIGAVSIKTALPTTPMKLFTFGQPRTGDAAYASFVESAIGVNNIFRAVHTFDGVPTIPLPGYRHHATQYWQFRDPVPIVDSPASTVTKCSGGEDPTCSNLIPSTGINAAHVLYFGQVMAINPLLCV